MAMIFVDVYNLQSKYRGFLGNNYAF